MKEHVIETAGYMRELYVWQLLRDVAGTVNEGKHVSSITPHHITWDNDSFNLTITDSMKEAVSEKDLVWQLAATAFHLFMGCPVFNGKGQQGQHADSPLPYMRKSMPELSNLICQMLAYDAAQRPTMIDVCKVAEINIARLHSKRSVRLKRTYNANENNNIKDFWPDEME